MVDSDIEKNKNIILVTGSFLSIFGAALLLFLPEQGSFCFLGGAMAVFVGANNGAPNVEPGWCLPFLVIPAGMYYLLLEPMLARRIDH